MTDTTQAHQGNLPAQLTPFIGREAVKREVARHLLRDDVRLLTLIGPPGIGKTRLSLEVAREVGGHFHDGTWFVSLALVSDPSLVPSTIAHTLGLQQAGERSLQEILFDYLRDKSLLLVLDNFEQVVEAAPVVADLLSAAPGIKALVTSREPLRVRGEQEYAVPSLTLPNLDRLPSAEQVSQYEAVQLFAQRARSASLDFQMTDENALVVAAICWRLDGLPLAIELAAARTKLLPPQALFERLGQRLALLTGGARDLPGRHKTLRSAIDWSYNLLDESEQRVFRRLGVFVGGCRWEAVDAVCNPDARPGTDTLDIIAALLDKSLVQQTHPDGGVPRLTMLETLKEYALEQLEANGEAADTRQRHAFYYLGLAEAWTNKTFGQEGSRWLQRLEEERDNLRAALRWAQSEALEGRIEPDIPLRLAAAMQRFWYVRGYLSEGRGWMVGVLSLPGADKYKKLQAEVYINVARLSYVQCDYRPGRAYFETSLAISREIDYKPGIGLALDGLGEVDIEEGDNASALAHFQASLVITRAIGNDRLVASVLNNLGYIALRTGDYAAALAPFQECLDLYQPLRDLRGMGFALQGLGETALRLGDYSRATAWLDEGYTLRQELGDKWGIAISLASLGWVALLQKEYAQAVDYIDQSIVRRRDIGDTGGLAWCMEKLADLFRELEQTEEAVSLLAIAKTLRDSNGSVIGPADQPEHDRNIAHMRAQLGDSDFAAAWSKGSSMTFEEGIKYALSIAPVQSTSLLAQSRPDHTTPEDLGGLTRREREIAALIAQSKSNAEIADMLTLSKRTVESHIANILSKLSFTSRGQIAAWALSKKLLQGI